MPADGKVVFVSSPYRGNVARNVATARAGAHLVFEAGHVPIVPHLYITRVLDDNLPAEREMGIRAALVLLSRCDEMWVFGPPSEGMRMEIEEAGRLDVPIVELPLPTPASPCWRCRGTRVIATDEELPSYVPCPECTRPPTARPRPTA